MHHIKYLVLIFACSTCVYGASYVKKCKAEDTKCAKESAQAFLPVFAAGIKDLGVKPLDPVTFKTTDASSPNLNLIVTDYTITGLRNCLVNNVKYDKSQSKIFLNLQCSGQLEGFYDMKGQLLVLRLEGKGPVHVTLNKANFDIVLDITEKEKNGNKYWNIKNWNYTYEIKDKSKVVFDNLFGGNEVLGKAARDVIDESGNEIIMEIGTPIISDCIKTVVEDINRFFHQVPINDLVE